MSRSPLRVLNDRFDFAALHALYPERYPHFLESAAAGTPQGRFDILFASPGESLWLDERGRLHESHAGGGEHDFLEALDHWFAAEQTSATQTQSCFADGWFIFLGYELAAQIEPILRLKTESGLPVAFAQRCRAAVVYDHQRHETSIIAAPAECKVIEADLLASKNYVLDPLFESVLAGSIIEETPDSYLHAVERALHDIHEGEIFQANLARGWKAKLASHVSAGQLYARLRACNPAPFAGLASWDDWAVLSSSPERLLRIVDRNVETRPIAGTRPRGGARQRDVALLQELIAHPKERAEHIMLIDLERNDLGKVCEAGSVIVDEQMVLESYAHVHHIVSNVRGKLRSDVTPGQAIRAVFPGGTITGCPKVRCMQIIAELEAGPRGPYTGALGYLDTTGRLDLNILIRTMVLHGQEMHFHAGAGIVADSIPEAELMETRAKALGLLNALGAHH